MHFTKYSDNTDRGGYFVDLRKSRTLEKKWITPFLFFTTFCSFGYVLFSTVRTESHFVFDDVRLVVVDEATDSFASSTVSVEEIHDDSSAVSDHFPFVQNRVLRNIEGLAIGDTVPNEGKMIVADLKNMEMLLFEDGVQTESYHITSIGRRGTPWATPSGLYSIHTKERTHFSSIANVYMPYSMQFYGNYFIHGRTYYPDGTLTSATFSGGCIKLDTADAEKVYQFADIGTQVFVYDSKETPPVPTLFFDTRTRPTVTASAYLIADLDTGDVYAEQNANTQYSVSAIALLMSALVANETISFNKLVTIRDSSIRTQNDVIVDGNKKFYIEDLMYPLLLSSNTHVAESLASYIGKNHFVQWMNNAALAYGMKSTSFVDASGVSPLNRSTPDDLFRLSSYITRNKSFIFDITRKDSTTISAIDGTSYEIQNGNMPVNVEPFIGGKAGLASTSNDSMLSLLQLHTDNEERTLVLIVLDSRDRVEDIEGLADWVSVAYQNTKEQNSACISCALPQYRKIELQ